MGATAAAAYLLSLAVQLWHQVGPPAAAAAGPVAAGAQAMEAVSARSWSV